MGYIDDQNNNTLSTEDTIDIPAVENDYTQDDLDNFNNNNEDNEDDQFEDFSVPYPIADKDSIKALLDALYADDTDTLLANWDDTNKVTSKMVNALKSAVYTKDALDKGTDIGICPSTSYSPTSDSKYSMIFSSQKEAYPGSGGAEIVVTYDIANDTAYYTEFWPWG